MQAVVDLSVTVGVTAACDALGVARSAFYRQRPRPRLVEGPPVALRRPPARALRTDEREAVLATLHAERFRDCAPAAVQATLLDEGTYLCSSRTMYRVLAHAGESRERRDQLVHPAYQKPELLATAPNQLLTPAMVHFGDAPIVLARRQTVLDAAYAAHPERFVRHAPVPLPLPSAVWINKPRPAAARTEEIRQ